MPKHNVDLFDEIHRVFLLGEELSTNPAKTSIKLKSTKSGGTFKHSLVITTNGKSEIVPLGGVKIPPDTGEETYLKVLSQTFR